MGLLALCCSAAAQVAITALDYGTTTDGTDRYADNLTFRNQVTPVEYVSSALGTYSINGQVATSVTFRRNTAAGNANSASVFYAYSSNDGERASVIGKGDSSPTLSEVMLSGDLNQGLRNPFANDSRASAGTNIERIDFYFAGGYTVQAGDAIALFDLENPGDHGDGFRIAAFTNLGTVNGSSNAPTAFANTGLLIQPGSYGEPLPAPNGSNARYLVSTTSNGDNLASNQSLTTLDSNSGTPNSSDLYLVGILIRFTDLGLNVGDTIYGYSLMAGDVTANSGADLVNWNNATVYATDTDASTWGNADFAGFGAQIARPVPEPTAFGLLFLASGLGYTLLRGRKVT